MKKIVTFEKKIDFPTMIGEVCAISLDSDLKFIDESNIEGDLILTGKYKLTEASRLEEDFNYNIPTEISLTEKIDLNTSNIEISDFYYEIENDDVMICHIELLIEGLEIVSEDKENDETLEDDRECDGDVLEKEVEIPMLVQEEKEEDTQEIEVDDETDNTSDVNEVERGSLFGNLEDDSDTYGTFIVYIVRQNESINSIIEKYHTTVEELQKYNDINNIDIGTKLIIPFVNE